MTPESRSGVFAPASNWLALPLPSLGLLTCTSPSLFLYIAHGHFMLNACRNSSRNPSRKPSIFVVTSPSSSGRVQIGIFRAGPLCLVCIQAQKRAGGFRIHPPPRLSQPIETGGVKYGGTLGAVQKFVWKIGHNFLRRLLRHKKNASGGRYSRGLHQPPTGGGGASERHW